MKLSIGQVLHEPPSRRYEDWKQYTVVSIGRKWATLSGRNNRCTLDTLLRDCGGYSPRELYVDRAAYEQECALHAEWTDFARRINVARMPAGMTPEIIAQARALLGIEAKP